MRACNGRSKVRRMCGKYASRLRRCGCVGASKVHECANVFVFLCARGCECVRVSCLTAHLFVCGVFVRLCD
jgi:hypothetical protein